MTIEEKIKKAEARAEALRAKQQLMSRPDFRVRSKESATLRRAAKVVRKYLGSEEPDLEDNLKVLAQGIASCELEPDA